MRSITLNQVLKTETQYDHCAVSSIDLILPFVTYKPQYNHEGAMPNPGKLSVKFLLGSAKVSQGQAQ